MRTVARSLDGAIGVFDSGIGGVSILRAIRAALPAEHLVYVADAGHLPYGDKPREQIAERALAVTQFLVNEGAKAVVVACNTATAAAIDELRAAFAMPLIGVEPAVKPAAQLTRSGLVGVLVTGFTGSSSRLDQLLDRFGGRAQIVVQPCPGLVEQVECGAFDDESTRRLVRRYVEPLLAQGVDTLVLGCTHYVFLEPAIRTIAGPSVTVLETGAPVVRQLVRRLEASQLLRPAGSGDERFWTTGDAEHLTQLLRRIWMRDAPVAHWGRSARAK